MLITQLPIFLQRTIDDVLEFRWNFRVQPHRSDRRAIQNGVKNLRRAASRECLFSRHHFIEHQTERKNIRAAVQFFSPRLLGRHVRECAHSCAGHAQLLRILSHRGIGVGSRLCVQFCQTEI